MNNLFPEPSPYENLNYSTLNESFNQPKKTKTNIKKHEKKYQKNHITTVNKYEIFQIEILILLVIFFIFCKIFFNNNHFEYQNIHNL